MTDRDALYGSALRLLRYREDLGFSSFNTTTSGQRKLRYPDVMIIGAQKAGTTWLHTQLSYHPNIWFSPIKEMNYFNQIYAPSEDDWESSARRMQAVEARAALEGLEKLSVEHELALRALDVVDEPLVSDDWYGRVFACAPAEDFCAESSPEYCVLPRAGIAHIASLNPRMKAILLVRDPIERAWSHIRMAVNGGYASPSIEYLRDDYNWRVFQGRSNYAEMVRRWRTILGDGQVIVLNYDQISTAPLALLQSVCDRLGLMFDPRFFPDATSKVGVGESLDIPADVYEMAKGRMRNIYDALWQVMPAEADAWIARHYYGDGPRTTNAVSPRAVTSDNVIGEASVAATSGSLP